MFNPIVTRILQKYNQKNIVHNSFKINQMQLSIHLPHFPSTVGWIRLKSLSIISLNGHPFGRWQLFLLATYPCDWRAQQEFYIRGAPPGRLPRNWLRFHNKRSRFTSLNRRPDNPIRFTVWNFFFICHKSDAFSTSLRACMAPMSTHTRSSFGSTINGDIFSKLMAPPPENPGWPSIGSSFMMVNWLLFFLLIFYFDQMISSPWTSLTSCSIVSSQFLLCHIFQLLQNRTALE